MRRFFERTPRPQRRLVREVRARRSDMRITLPVGLLGLVGSIIAACAGETNSDPEILPLDDVVCRVNQSCQITVNARDIDNDPLEYTTQVDPAPPTETQGQSGRPTITRIDNSRALFTWTPGAADAGDGEARYDVTFVVTDGRGGRDSRRIALTVSSDGSAGRGRLRFIEPSGGGMAHDLAQGPCVEGLTVEVKGDEIDNGAVSIVLAPPVSENATLTPPGVNGKRKTFSFCPSEGQLDESLDHTVTFQASETSGDEPVLKRFTIHFKRRAGAGCAGEAPVIEHTPPGPQGGALNYPVEATIRDDVGFKSPPYVSFSTDADATGGDTSGWETVELRPEGADRWRTEIPNLGLPEGQEQTVYYVITATDNDDESGTRCDHSTESEMFRFVARGGGSAPLSGQTYGACQPCVADDQCGEIEDLCVTLRGEQYCATSCEFAACPAGQECVEIDGTNTTNALQCVPADSNCGQLCTPDANETPSPNDFVESATAVGVGSYPALSVCEEDLDLFAIPVEAQQSIRVRIDFSHDRGDLDLLMRMPGGAEFDYRSESTDDAEEVSERCAISGGTATVAVFGFQNAINQYDLTIEVGPGRCNEACTDDAFESATGNDTIDDFAPVDAFPFEQADLAICRGSPDFYGFEAQAGEIIQAAISFDHAEGDLELRLRRSTGDVLASSESARDVELIEVEAPVDDVYVLEVFASMPNGANRYALIIDKFQLRACSSTRECPAGAFCAGGRCYDAGCDGFGTCGAGHQCIAPRAGLDPASIGGTCVADCAGDADCRQDQGYVCKHLEDYTQACAPSGAGAVGDRCSNYAECAGAQVCFNVPGGYCSAGGCDFDADCAGGGICGTLNGLPACLKPCQNDGACRVGEGYRCADVAGRRACLP